MLAATSVHQKTNPDKSLFHLRALYTPDPTFGITLSGWRALEPPLQLKTRRWFVERNKSSHQTGRGRGVGPPGPRYRRASVCLFSSGERHDWAVFEYAQCKHTVNVDLQDCEWVIAHFSLIFELLVRHLYLNNESIQPYLIPLS